MTIRYDIMTPLERGEGNEKKTFWLRIGSAWAKDDYSTVTGTLDAFPVNGRFVLSLPKPKKPTGEF